jgi:hypothetical protein
MPRCFWYQEASAALSPLHLRKTPPIPVIPAMVRISTRLAISDAAGATDRVSS